MGGDRKAFGQNCSSVPVKVLPILVGTREPLNKAVDVKFGRRLYFHSYVTFTVDFAVKCPSVIERETSTHSYRNQVALQKRLKVLTRDSTPSLNL